MVLPNFLIIGAAKAGTTSIAQYLNQHPQIYISPIKEPFFFSFEGQDINFSGPGDRESLRLAITRFQEYEKLFENVSNETAIGEASTSYLYTPQTPKRIRQYLPNVKLIAILRNPVDKAYSSFLHQVREGFEPLDNFSEALKYERVRIRENWMYFWHYKRNGFYYENLKRYYELFPQSQIRVYLYSDFKKDPLKFMQSLFTFLDVDLAFEPDFSIRYNISGIPRSRILHHLMTESKIVKRLLKPLIPRPMRQKARKVNLAKPKLNDELKSQLINEYREDIMNLQNLINRDLSEWLQ